MIKDDLLTLIRVQLEAAKDPRIKSITLRRPANVAGLHEMRVLCEDGSEYSLATSDIVAMKKPQRGSVKVSPTSSDGRADPRAADRLRAAQLARDQVDSDR